MNMVNFYTNIVLIASGQRQVAMQENKIVPGNFSLFLDLVEELRLSLITNRQ